MEVKQQPKERLWGKSRLLVSLFGAAGAGLSSIMILGVLHPIAQTEWIPEQFGLTAAILLEGFCFVPLGLSITLAISTYGRVRQGRTYLLAAGAFAGFALGGFAVFSIFGGLLGLVVLGAILAVGLSGDTDLRPSRVAVGFLGLAVVLFLLLRFGGNELGMKMMLVLYPSVALGVVGPIGILWATLLGYGLALFTLALLWPRSIEGTP